MIETQMAEQGNSSYKPHIAEMAQTEMADILSVMCLKDKRYRNITLYGKDGVGCSTSIIDSQKLTFLNRPNDLNLGFLTPEILSGARAYKYTYNNTMYEERIYPIFKSDGSYSIKNNEDGILVGYLSYIVGQP